MGETKVCTKCGEEKDLSEYTFKGNGKKRNDCKSCRKIYQAKWVAENPEAQIRLIVKRRALRLKMKEGLSCSVCGENRPATLDFHHPNAEDKLGDVSDMFRMHMVDKLEAEIEKCIVLCATCHRAHHEELYEIKLAGMIAALGERNGQETSKEAKNAYET